jgi:HAD superfamily hydrolase (TIGR01509 family)
VVKAVFFDVGDTLILGHPKYWLWPVLKAKNLAHKADLTDLQQGMHSAYKHYADNHMQANDEARAMQFWYAFHHKILDSIRLGPYTEEIAAYLRLHWRSPGVWPLTPQAKEVLRALKNQGLKLAVVSNWDWTLPGVLGATGLDFYFDYVAVSALEGHAKPSPKLFEIALNQLKLAPEQVLHIGDSPDDIEGAKAAGIQPILFDAYGKNPGALHNLGQLLQQVNLAKAR